jgi:hypothetical protein
MAHSGDGRRRPVRPLVGVLRTPLLGDRHGGRGGSAGRPGRTLDYHPTTPPIQADGGPDPLRSAAVDFCSDARIANDERRGPNRLPLQHYPFTTICPEAKTPIRRPVSSGSMPQAMIWF